MMIQHMTAVPIPQPPSTARAPRETLSVSVARLVMSASMHAKIARRGLAR